MQSARGPYFLRQSHQKASFMSAEGRLQPSTGLTGAKPWDPFPHQYTGSHNAGGWNSKSGFGFPGFRVVQLSHIDSPAHVF